MQLLDRILLSLRHVFLTCANLLLLAMLVANAVNIAWRALLGTAFNWVFPWTMMAFLWMVFIGFYVFVHDRRDVTVDVIVKRFPQVLRRLCAVLAVVVPVAMLVVLLGTIPAVLQSQADRIDMVGLPRFSITLPLFASAALVLVVTLRRAPELWAGLPQTDHAHPPEGAD